MIFCGRKHLSKHRAQFWLPLPFSEMLVPLVPYEFVVQCINIINSEDNPVPNVVKKSLHVRICDSRLRIPVIKKGENSFGARTIHSIENQMMQFG